MQNFQAITFTNSGYLEFTMNLLRSAEVNSVKINIIVYCTDVKSYDYIRKNKYSAILLNPNGEISEKLSPWKAGDGEFGKIMISKFEAIHDSLQKNKFVLYIDGDVVIKKDFNEYFQKNIDNNDFLFQLDYNPKRIEQNDLCAGFMFIKSSNKSVELFNPEPKKVSEIIELPSHDQTYLNLNKKEFKYKFLPLSEFPNGAYFTNFKTKPSIVHFNYIIGKNKKKIMQKMGEWYL